jgi:iron complex transport system ATP-binding protein
VNPALVVGGVRAGYEDREVLHGVDLEVMAGEWVVVIGPNGSGKSTLLRVIAGILDTKGEVSIDGSVVGGLPRRAVARLVAMVPQLAIIPPGMRVLDYVLLGRTPYLAPWGAEGTDDVALVERLLGDLDLDGFAAREVAALSGGERQMVVLARALAQEARVLLLDEPTTALDIGHQQRVLELVDRLRQQRGIAVVGAMHDLTLAGQFADRLVLLFDGALVAAGTPAEVLDSAVLTEYYRARISVMTGPEGGPVVVPLRGGATRESSAG